MREVLTTEQQLGRKIRIARVEASLSQAELARAVFESQQMVSDWEMGVVSPRAIALMRVAIALGKQLDYFEVCVSEDSARRNRISKSAPEYPTATPKHLRTRTSEL